jgi:hypothetical protein
MFRRNTYLLSVVVVGAIVTTVGGTGIFAVFTDRATQGPNTVQSGARPRAADIQIATADFVAGAAADCGTFQENITTALWTAANMQPGDTERHYMCVKNNGAAAFTTTLSVIDMTSSDPLCTGDEASVDPGCGPSPLAGGGLLQLCRLDAFRYESFPAGKCDLRRDDVDSACLLARSDSGRRTARRGCYRLSCHRRAVPQHNFGNDHSVGAVRQR